eukprot:m.466381 g.466381  ORF g.466381 m.466381 type:complete len:147 (-) comp25153_c0_seq1:130-570(-)
MLAVRVGVSFLSLRFGLVTACGEGGRDDIGPHPVPEQKMVDVPKLVRPKFKPDRVVDVRRWRNHVPRRDRRDLSARVCERREVNDACVLPCRNCAICSGELGISVWCDPRQHLGRKKIDATHCLNSQIFEFLSCGIVPSSAARHPV